MGGKQAGGKSKAGRKPSLTAEHVEMLRTITAEQPRSSLDEVTRELHRRTGAVACAATVRKALRAAGITRLKPVRAVAARAPVQGGQAVRYGYTAAHRREDGASGMNTDLTDAEWALVAELFERDGGRGTPARYGRRHVVNACCYVLRTGCAWRLLPKTFPPWQATYKAFSRWASAGVFEAMHDRLRQQWRDRIGKAPEPSAAIIDAQSTRSTPQGGQTGFDAGKKVKGRKRHLVVDTLGLLLAVTITAASVQDRDAAAPVVAQACAKVPGLKKLYADGAYGGQCAVAIEQTHRRDPGRVMGVLMQAFVIKVLFFGAYVVVMFRVVGVSMMPFVVSFTSYFLVLYLVEALMLQRLSTGSASGPQQPS